MIDLELLTYTLLQSGGNLNIYNKYVPLELKY